MRVEILVALISIIALLGLGLQGDLQFTSWESSFTLSFNENWQMIDAKAVLLPTSIICEDQYSSFSLGDAVLLAWQSQDMLYLRSNINTIDSFPGEK